MFTCLSFLKLQFLIWETSILLLQMRADYDKQHKPADVFCSPPSEARSWVMMQGAEISLKLENVCLLNWSQSQPTQVLVLVRQFTHSACWIHVMQLQEVMWTTDIFRRAWLQRWVRSWHLTVFAQQHQSSAYARLAARGLQHLIYNINIPATPAAERTLSFNGCPEETISGDWSVSGTVGVLDISKKYSEL